MLRLAGVLARNLGRIEQAIVLARRAVDQDPLGATTYLNLALSLYSGDRLAEAEGACLKALELAPQSAMTRAVLSLILLAQNRGEEALAQATREPHEAVRLWALSIIHHLAGRQAASDEALRELIAKHARDGAYQVAEVYAARGEADAAFEWLDRARVERDTGLTGVKADPSFRSLRSDPRWAAFLNRIGLGN